MCFRILCHHRNSMTVIHQLARADMVTTFIRAELASPRFRENMLTAGKEFGLSEVQLLDAPHDKGSLDDLRHKVLVWARPGIMKTLPDDIAWQEVLLSPEEWSRVQYINDEPWVVFSDKTRLVTRGAAKAMQESGRTIHQRIAEIHLKIQRGDTIEKIILLADPKLSKLVVVEGHVRATSFLALGLESAAKFPVILGISERPEHWLLY